MSITAVREIACAREGERVSPSDRAASASGLLPGSELSGEADRKTPEVLVSEPKE